MNEGLAQAEHSFAQRRTREALLFFNEAERGGGSSADVCAGGRWLCHMLHGDFEQALRESDNIFQRSYPDPNRFWNGEPLDGERVLIRCLRRGIARCVVIESAAQIEAIAPGEQPCRPGRHLGKTRAAMGFAD